MLHDGTSPPDRAGIRSAHVQRVSFRLLASLVSIVLSAALLILTTTQHLWVTSPATEHGQLRAVWQLPVAGAAPCVGGGVEDAALAAARDAPGAPQTRQARAKARAPTAGLLRIGEAAVALALPSPAPAHDLSPLLPNSATSRLYVIVGDQSGWQTYVSEEYFHLFAHLANTFFWRVLNENAFREQSSGEDIAALFVREFGRAPDVLLFMEGYDDIVRTRSMAPHFPGTALWLFIDDLHYETNEARRLWKRAGVLAADLVLGAYMYELDVFFPEAASVARAWIPHGASSIYQLPMRPAAAVARAVLLSGSTERKHYPYRAMVEDKIRGGDTRFVQHVHPGYVKHDTTAGSVGSAFAAKLNAHLACLTDGLRYDYAVGKIFEIPAAGCLLLANNELAPHLAPLGFEPGVHYLTYTAESLDELVDAVLDERNNATIDAIRAQGQALVWSRHTVTHRAAAMHELAGAIPPTPSASALPLAREQSDSGHISDAARACFASLTRAALAEPRRNDTVDILIFSKDRPMRLLSLLESQMAYVANQGSVTVIFDGSEPEHRAAYAVVADLFPGVLFVSEADFSAAEGKPRFQLAVESALRQFSAPYTTSIVDEMIWLRKVDLAHVAAHMAASSAGADSTFQLRMGMSLVKIDDAQPSIAPHAPSLAAVGGGGVRCFTWTSPDMSPPTAAYTTIVDGAVFDARRLAADWAALRYAHPGELETQWYAARPSFSRPCAHMFFDDAALCNFESTAKVRIDNADANPRRDASALTHASMLVQMGLHIDWSGLVARRQKPPYPHVPEEPLAFLPLEKCGAV